MHLGRSSENHRVGALDPFGQFAAEMRNAIFLGDLRGRVLVAADQRRHFDVGNALERIEMLLPERALSRYANFHCCLVRLSEVYLCSRPSCPALCRASTT